MALELTSFGRVPDATSAKLDFFLVVWPGFRDWSFSLPVWRKRHGTLTLLVPLHLHITLMEKLRSLGFLRKELSRQQMMRPAGHSVLTVPSSISRVWFHTRLSRGSAFCVSPTTAMPNGALPQSCRSRVDIRTIPPSSVLTASGCSLLLRGPSPTEPGAACVSGKSSVLLLVGVFLVLRPRQSMFPAVSGMRTLR